MSRQPLRRRCCPQCERLDDRCLLSIITPAQVRHAYGADATSLTANGRAVPANGAGQVVAIVVAYHDPNLTQDVHVFDTAYGLADPKVTQVNLAGSATDDGWAGEESMDVQWVHAMAPGAAIDVVEARSNSISDLMAAVNVARRLSGVSVVSMSWGGSEFSGETAYDSTFTTPAGIVAQCRVRRRDDSVDQQRWHNSGRMGLVWQRRRL
jgi:subtilase family serine protease